MAKEIKLIRIRKAAEMLGVNPETLRRWDRQGRLKAIKIGKRGDRRYEFAQIERVIKQQK